MSKQNKPEELVIIEEATEKKEIDILIGMWNELHETHLRNKVNELYVQGLFIMNKNNQNLAQKLAEIQADVRGRVPYLNYLAGKINQLKTYDKPNTK